MAPVFCQFEWASILSVDMVICVLTFLFIDMFDTIGTLIGVSNRAGMVDENGNIPHLKNAFMADAIGTTLGAVLGTSTVTTYVESASGVNVGGRSGLTSFTTALCFLVSLFLAPLFLSIPSEATAPALVLVGGMMMHDIRKVDFQNYITAIPCFVCIAFMPLTYSISDGILMGLITWVLIHLCCGKWKEMNIGMVILAAGVIGLFTQPLIGWSIKRFGERNVTIFDSVMLAGLCLAYAFAPGLLPLEWAVGVVGGCFVLDKVLFAMGMARTTYITRICGDRRHEITPCIYTGIAINHVASITYGIVGGIIWQATGGPQAVFLIGGLAVVAAGLLARKMK